MKKHFLTVLLMLPILCLGQAELEAVFETDPVLNLNGADDPAIWLHPTDPDLSFFVGTDKQTLGRLELYNSDGTRFWSTESGTKYNNVDVMYNFEFEGDTIDVVIASNNSDNTIDIYRVDVENRNLVDITGSTLCDFNNLYGLVAYHDLCNHKYYVFLTRRTTDGKCYQYEITDNGNGGVDTELVRILSNLPSRTEGMCADYMLGHFYIAEESIGIWKYGARPEDGQDRILMDSVAGPNLTALVEGLCIYYSDDSIGYLLATSQGASNYQVYEREGENEYLGTFSIEENTDAGIDEVNSPDGIDVISFPFGSNFPQGAFITQDTQNGVGFTNYKILPWESIAEGLELRIDTLFNPRYLLPDLCDSLPPLSISNLEFNQFKVFPNPASDYLNIELNLTASNSPYQIYDSMGRLVLSGTLNEQRIYVADLNDGLYYVVVNNSVNTWVKRSK